MTNKKSLTFKQICALYKKEIGEYSNFETELCSICDFLIDKGLRITAQVVDEQIKLIGVDSFGEEEYHVWVGDIGQRISLIHK